jgi:lysozyme
VGIANHEGYVGKTYLDTGGIPTNGYGHTGKDVKLGQTITPQRALIQLSNDVSVYAQGVQKCIHVPMAQSEFDASVDFAFNAGIGRFCTSEMAEKFNKLDYEGACKAFIGKNVYDHKGHLLTNLVGRRQEEYLTCIGNESTLKEKK